jgi:hypothetical protein
MGSSQSTRQQTAKKLTSKQGLAGLPPSSSPFAFQTTHKRTRLSQWDGAPEKLFTSGENLKDKLVGVIITIFDGSSYDAMFREVRPTTVPGERISTYSMSYREVEKLHVFLASTVPIPENQIAWKNIIDDVRQVPADSVVFNFECCSGCGDNAFPCGDDACFRQGLQQEAQMAASNVTMKFLGFALRSGFTVMCSDFSLKSLIFEWSEEELGPNPFLKVGSCDHQFSLEFEPSELQNEEVPQQLQVVGELCADKGKAIVSAMGSTIVYTVDPKRKQTDLYDLKVLTVVTDFCGEDTQISDNMKCTVGEGGKQRRGAAGHVTLTYAEGGQLVTSMGHWIELARIDASLESVMRVAAHNFGGTEAEDFRRVYMEQTSDAARHEWIQSNCHRYVTQSAPSRMKTRTKY